MGIFKRIQAEIELRERQEGITPADLLDLSAELRTLMNRITREGEMTAAGAAAQLGVVEEEGRKMLDALVEKGYLSREKRGEEWVYQTRFGRTRGRELPGGLWSAPGQRTDRENK